MFFATIRARHPRSLVSMWALVWLFFGGSALPAAGGVPADRFVPAVDIEIDLDLFVHELSARSIYLQPVSAELTKAVDALRSRARDSAGLSVGELASLLQQILNATGDPGARVQGVDALGPFLPFAIAPVKDRYVATWHDGAGFLVTGKPFVATLGGETVDFWLGGLADLLPSASAATGQQLGLDRLQAFGAARRELGCAPDSTVTVGVADAAGSTAEIEVKLQRRPAGKIPWPLHNSEVLEGNIGYLRLARMDARAVDRIGNWMPRFQKTAGLIVDVRGNSGGSRDAILALFPYFLRFDDPPFVAAAARYREHAGLKWTDLETLAGHAADWPGWHISQRSAIENFRASFPPATEAADSVGTWRYLVISRRDNDPRFPYLNHMVVLVDGGSRGATELLLASCRRLPKISLMGTPSGGTADGTEPFTLPRTGLQILVTSLVTYLPDGSRLGAAPIEPDILSYPEPESFLPGGQDVQLERARQYLVMRGKP
jgi:hypothetical protein